MRSIGPAAVLFLLMHVPSQAQDTTPRTKLLLTLECWKQGIWKTVDAQSVFKQQDRLRFRFKPSIAGYLYILNQSSSGTVSWIYPLPDKGPKRLVGGQEVVVPGGDGSFAISGTPGFDTLYWILSHAPMTVPQIQQEQLETPSTLISRCPEELPGEKNTETSCLDKNAGARIADPKIKAALGVPDSLVPRDLTFEAKPKGTEISTESDGRSGEIIYQVRIAHN